MNEPLRPLRCRPACFQAFSEALERLDQPGALLRAASAVALHEHPDADLDLVERRVEGLAEEVRRLALGRSLKARLGFLHQVLFEQHAFQGDEQTYSNPGNSYLPMVLATQRGLPIVLTLIYVEVARRAGLVAHGLDAPLHFLAEVEQPDGPQIVDPFYRGRALSRAEVRERIERVLMAGVRADGDPMPRAHPRGWLDRILRNLETSFARAGRLDEQAAMGELRTLLRATPAGPSPEARA